MRFCAIVGHVIGDNVLHPTQIVTPRPIDQREEFLLAAKLRVEPVGIDDVVAMHAARARVKDRRRVNIADTEFAQIRDHRVRVGKAELRGELQPIGRRRNFHGNAL